MSDVLIVGNRPSALERWGIDYDSVHAAHPELIMLHVSGYGRGGPKSDRPGYGTLAEAMCGFAHLTGQPDGPPTLPPFMLADGVASLAATYAVMMALYHRDVHGAGGQLIDVNLIEPLARLMESSTLSYDQLGMELGSMEGKTTRYRSFFVLDRTRATTFNNPAAPGDFRDVVVYRKSIE